MKRIFLLCSFLTPIAMGTLVATESLNIVVDPDKNFLAHLVLLLAVLLALNFLIAYLNRSLVTSHNLIKITLLGSLLSIATIVVALVAGVVYFAFAMSTSHWSFG